MPDTSHSDKCLCHDSLNNPKDQLFVSAETVVAMKYEYRCGELRFHHQALNFPIAPMAMVHPGHSDSNSS